MKKMLVVLLFIGCNSINNKQNNITLPEIRTSTCIENNISNLTRFIDSTKITQLEIGPNGEFIFDIDKILFLDDYLFVVDKFGRQVVKYDNEGNYIFSLSKRGNGNGEYNTFSDATLIKNSLYVLDAPSSTILKYSAINGDFIHKFKVEKIAGMSMNSVNDVIVIFNENNDYYLNENIILYDTLGLIKKTFMPILKINKNSSFALNLNLFNNDNKLFLINCFDDYIYEIDSNDFYPKYRLNYGNSSLTESEIKRISKSSDRDKMLKIESLLSGDKYSMLYDYYSVLSDYIIGTSINCDKRIYSIYTKNNNETTNIDDHLIPIEYEWFIASKGNIAYSRINYPVISSLFTNENNDVVTTINSEIMEHFAKADTMQVNPLLVKTYFKSAK